MCKQLPDLKNLVNSIALHNTQKEYKKLFDLLFPSLYRFAYSLLKSKEQAEEVASDVMIALWYDRQTLIHIENIKVYAFVIARNKSLNILKKQARQEIIALDDIDIELVLNAPTPEQILINDELKEKLESAVQSLPSKCKLVFKLVKEEGLSYKETAEILKISVKTVDAHLVTAVKKLACCLQIEFNLA